MATIQARCLSMSLVVCAAACSNPTSPTLPIAPEPPAATEFVGEWAGTTSQGATVAFSVSDDQVTSFTLSLKAPPSCSGTETIPGPVQIGLRPDKQRGFLISKIKQVGTGWEWAIAIYGVFAADRQSAWGEIQTANYPACGTINLEWIAKRL